MINSLSMDLIMESNIAEDFEKVVRNLAKKNDISLLESLVELSQKCESKNGFSLNCFEKKEIKKYFSKNLIYDLRQECISKNLIKATKQEKERNALENFLTEIETFPF